MATEAVTSDAEITYLEGAGGGGDIAAKLMANGGDFNSLRTNDVLRKEEWELFDEVLMEEARYRLHFVSDLQSRGLTYQLGNAFGTTILEWERIGDMNGAEVSMDGVYEGRRDRLEFALDRMPIPIIHKDFQINIRQLEASRRRGEPLDTTMARIASRKVMEKIEEMHFYGHSIREGAGRIYGPLTHPQRIRESAQRRGRGNFTPISWEDPATTGAAKLGQVIDMINALKSQKMMGPFELWISDLAYLQLSQDYKSESDNSQLARLVQTPDLALMRP